MIISKIFKGVKDKRNNRGKRYNLSPILSLILSGLLRGCNNLASVHRWGKSLSKKELMQLGFYKGKLCCYSSLTLIFRQADHNDLIEIMNKLSGVLNKPIYHIDGKFLKNSNSHGGKKQVQILTMFNNEKAATVNYQEIESRDECKAMKKLLDKSYVKDAIITADAAFTHQEILGKIVDKGADFAISLKGNEANLKYNTEQLFKKSEEENLKIDSFTEKMDCLHGRIEQRSIQVLDMPWEYLNGHKNIKQLCKITRFRMQKNKPNSAETEIAYMVTSLNKNFSTQQLLQLNRSHWSCENNLNWVKDAVFFEDKSTLSIANAPIIMSLLRSLAIQIIKSISDKITATRELFSFHNYLIWRKIATLSCDF